MNYIEHLLGKQFPQATLVKPNTSLKKLQVGEKTDDSKSEELNKISQINKDWFKNWYTNRVLPNPANNKDFSIAKQSYLDKLNTPLNIKLFDSNPENPFNFSIAGYYNPEEPNTINISNKIPVPSLNNLLFHEQAHLVDDFDEPVSLKDKDILGDYIYGKNSKIEGKKITPYLKDINKYTNKFVNTEIKSYADEFQIDLDAIKDEFGKNSEEYKTAKKDINNTLIDYKKRAKEESENRFRYLDNSDEIHARLMMLRKDAGFKPNEKIDIKKINNYKKLKKGVYPNSDIDDIFKVIKDDKTVVELLNTMADVNFKSNQQVMANGGFVKKNKNLPQYQWGQIVNKLNPYNWGVEDYTSKGDFNTAYSLAKKAGENEFMWNNKRYSTKYAGTPRQEVGRYGINGRSVDPKYLDNPAQVNLYPPLGQYLPGHIAASIKNNRVSVDYSPSGNFHYGLDRATRIGEKSYNVYGQNDSRFFNKVLSLPEGEYNVASYTPSDWNLFTNNCADNVCDAFGIPRSVGLQTPAGALSKIKEKYLTFDVKGRTLEDQYKFVSDRMSPDDILKNNKNLVSIYYSPDTYDDLKEMIGKKIQNALTKKGYKLPNSIKADGTFDGVFGPETETALMDWQIKNKNKYEQGGEMIKRADGSYSKRGLWDNIRANKGSGKKPTPEMLEQERKIKNKLALGGFPEGEDPTKPKFRPIITDINTSPNRDATTVNNVVTNPTTTNDNREIIAKGINENNKKLIKQKFESNPSVVESKRRNRVAESMAMQNKPLKERLTPEGLAKETQAIGDKLRWSNAPNVFDEYLNPAAMIGNMASGVGRIPLDIKEGNYGSAAMSVAAPLLTGAVAGMGAKNVGQFVNNLVNPVAGLNINKVIKKGTEIPEQINKTASSLQSWQLKELPGLHLKSTMEGEAISKIVEPKTGLINTEQALSIIGKESGGAEKVAIIKQSLGNNIPKKMDYNDFRKIVQDQLIPLERQFSEHSSNYGINRLGYPSPKRSSFEVAINNNKQRITELEKEKSILESIIKRNKNELNLGKEDNLKKLSQINDELLQSKIKLNESVLQMQQLPLENQTLVLGNKSKFGRGSSAHSNPDETLGHIHFLRDAETPDILTVTQIQSDAFQGTHRIMPKDLKNLTALEKQQKSLVRMEELQERNKAILNRMKTEGVDEAGVPVQDYQIKQFEQIVEAQENANIFKKADIENFTQKQLLDKNHQERYLQELVDYAGKRGDVNKIRVPTSETAAKVQGYSKSIPTELDNNLMPIGGGKYSAEHQTILKKYSEQPKNIKKLFGKEPTIVTDSKGNTWYEFDIPDKFKKGKGEIKAFGLLPVGVGAATYKSIQDDSNKFKMALGGKIPVTADGEKHLIYKKESPTGNGKGKKGHIMVTHPTKDKGKWDTIDLTDIADVKTIAEGIAATKKWHAENPKAQTGIETEIPLNNSILFYPTRPDNNLGYNGMVKSTIALQSAMGNPSAMRMTSVSPKRYIFSGNEKIDNEYTGVPKGEAGSHYMTSMDNYAVPYIQEKNGKLTFNSQPTSFDKEAIKLNSDDEAEYFAKNYKKYAPMMVNFNNPEYAAGGIHIKKANRGKFTAAADRANMGVQEYARHILANKENYSSTLVKRANFARNAAGWKHQGGGILLGHQYPQYTTKAQSGLQKLGDIEFDSDKAVPLWNMQLGQPVLEVTDNKTKNKYKVIRYDDGHYNFYTPDLDQNNFLNVAATAYEKSKIKNPGPSAVSGFITGFSNYRPYLESWSRLQNYTPSGNANNDRREELNRGVNLIGNGLGAVPFIPIAVTEQVIVDAKPANFNGIWLKKANSAVIINKSKTAAKNFIDYLTGKVASEPFSNEEFSKPISESSESKKSSPRKIIEKYQTAGKKKSNTLTTKSDYSWATNSNSLPLLSPKEIGTTLTIDPENNIIPANFIPLAHIKKLIGIPTNLTQKDTIIDITNIPLNYTKVNTSNKGKVILGGDFVETKNSNAIRKAKDWINVKGSFGDKNLPSEKVTSFYGVENGKFKVGKASDFNSETEIVPRRFGESNISKSMVDDTDNLRLFDDKQNLIYHNVSKNGKFILYSPSTKKSQFVSATSAQNASSAINDFINKNKDAQFIHLDNGRYTDYLVNPEGLTKQDFKDYYNLDFARQGTPGYNLIIEETGGQQPFHIKNMLQNFNGSKFAVGGIQNYDSELGDETKKNTSTNTTVKPKPLQIYIDPKTLLPPRESTNLNPTTFTASVAKSLSNKNKSIQLEKKLKEQENKKVYAEDIKGFKDVNLSINIEELTNKNKVKDVQRFLLSKGYDLGKFKDDGVIGKYTKDAINKYNQNLDKKVNFNYLDGVSVYKNRDGQDCNEIQCTDYTGKELFRRSNITSDYETFGNKLGLFSDAWNLGDALKNKGGVEVYNSDNKKTSKLSVNVGDVVIMYNQLGSDYQDLATKKGDGNTHTGFVSKVNSDGSYYISHNVHKKVGVDSKGNPIYKGRAFEEKIAPNSFNVPGKFQIKKIVRPNYKVLENNAKSVFVDPNNKLVYSGNRATAKQMVNLINANKQKTANYFKLDEDVHSALSQAALGIIEKESKFGDSFKKIPFVSEKPARLAYEKTVEAYKTIKNPLSYGKSDEASKGLGRIKYKINNYYTPEGKVKTNQLINLSKVNGNVNDEYQDYIFTLDLLNRNYNEFLKKGFSKEDAIYRAIQKHNSNTKANETDEGTTGNYNRDYSNKVLYFTKDFQFVNKNKKVRTILDKLRANEDVIHNTANIKSLYENEPAEFVVENKYQVGGQNTKMSAPRPKPIYYTDDLNKIRMNRDSLDNYMWTVDQHNNFIDSGYTQIPNIKNGKIFDRLSKTPKIYLEEDYYKNVDNKRRPKELPNQGWMTYSKPNVSRESIADYRNLEPKTEMRPIQKKVKYGIMDHKGNRIQMTKEEYDQKIKNASSVEQLPTIRWNYDISDEYKNQVGGYSTRPDLVSEKGYKDNSPFKDNPFLDIMSNNITMKGVSQPLIGISDKGDIKVMLPGEDYKFNGTKVREIPIYQGGGKQTEDEEKMLINWGKEIAARKNIAFDNQRPLDAWDEFYSGNQDQYETKIHPIRESKPNYILELMKKYVHPYQNHKDGEQHLFSNQHSLSSSRLDLLPVELTTEEIRQKIKRDSMPSDTYYPDGGYQTGGKKISNKLKEFYKCGGIKY